MLKLSQAAIPLHTDADSHQDCDHGFQEYEVRIDFVCYLMLSQISCIFEISFGKRKLILYRSAEDLFSSSLHAFRNALPPEERADFQQFSTADEMLGELRLHYSSRKNKRIEKSCRSVAIFAERLKPYFDVVGAFVQTNPEYIGWFWGATLLVCKVCLTFIHALSYMT